MFCRPETAISRMRNLQMNGRTKDITLHQIMKIVEGRLDT